MRHHEDHQPRDDKRANHIGPLPFIAPLARHIQLGIGRVQKPSHLLVLQARDDAEFAAFAARFPRAFDAVDSRIRRGSDGSAGNLLVLDELI